MNRRQSRYLPHVGNTCPVLADALVAVDLGDGSEHVDRAGQLYWGPGEGDDQAGRIRGFRVLGPVKHTKAQAVAMVRERMAALGLTIDDVTGQAPRGRAARRRGVQCLGSIRTN